MKTVKELKDYFEKIPDDKWKMNDYGQEGERRCAMGHLMSITDYDTTDVSDRPTWFFSDLCFDAGFHITGVNDGYDPKFTQITPKARVLALCDVLIEKGY